MGMCFLNCPVNMINCNNRFLNSNYSAFKKLAFLCICIVYFPYTDGLYPVF